MVLGPAMASGAGPGGGKSKAPKHPGVAAAKKSHMQKGGKKGGKGITVVAEGLNTPRGLAMADNGDVYVAEAGAGGETVCMNDPELGQFCIGTSASITEIKKNGKTSR